MSVKNNIKSPESQEEDFEAIRLVLAGDNRGFEVLQKKYNRLITSLIRRMIRNEEDVRDLTQDTFIKAYNAISSFQFGYSFSSWIYKIASNTCIDFLRKKRLAEVSLNQKSNSDEEYEIEIEDKDYMPDISLMTEEKLKTLREAIDKLPDNYKEIIKLRHEKEMDYADIAERLDIPLGTVKAHLFRARKQLFAQLKKYRYLFVEN
jgi:RNA polymerase sigma factor (sigma-70 family)